MRMKNIFNFFITACFAVSGLGELGSVAIGFQPVYLIVEDGGSFKFELVGGRAKFRTPVLPR